MEKREGGPRVSKGKGRVKAHTAYSRASKSPGEEFGGLHSLQAFRGGGGKGRGQVQEGRWEEDEWRIISKKQRQERNGGWKDLPSFQGGRRNLYLKKKRLETMGLTTNGSTYIPSLLVWGRKGVAYPEAYEQKKRKLGNDL